MEVLFIKAKPEEAKELSELRRKVWLTTYRGIYPDEIMDNFDYAAHNAKDLERITNPEFDVLFITANGQRAGYLVLQKKESLYIQSLYLLEEFRGLGIGRKAFEYIHDFCRKEGREGFYLGCHPQNIKALGFYENMGGTVTERDEGHQNNRENSLKIEFKVPKKSAP